MIILLGILGFIGIITLGFIYYYLIYYVILTLISNGIKFSCWLAKKGIGFSQSTDKLVETYVKGDEVHLVFKKRKPIDKLLDNARFKKNMGFN